MWTFEDNRIFNNYVEIDNAFSAEEIEKILELRKYFEYVEPTVGRNVIDKSYRTGKIWWLNPKEETYWLYREIHDLFLHVNKNFFQMSLSGFEDFQLSEYSENVDGHYNIHCDNALFVQKSKEHRKLSMSIQLSDSSEYEGGLFKIYPESFAKPICISQKKGTVVFFRSQILHEVTQVTRGSRYSLVTWACGPLLN